MLRMFDCFKKIEDEYDRRQQERREKREGRERERADDVQLKSITVEAHSGEYIKLEMDGDEITVDVSGEGMTRAQVKPCKKFAFRKSRMIRNAFR